MFRCAPLFDGDDERAQLAQIAAVLGPPPRDWTVGLRAADRLGFAWPQCASSSLAARVPTASPSALDLLRRMLEVDPRRRASCRELLAHEFFAEPSRRSIAYRSPDLYKSLPSARLFRSLSNASNLLARNSAFKLY